MFESVKGMLPANKKKFREVVEKIRDADDSRSYEEDLTPTLMQMKDSEGRTLLIHAAMKIDDYPDGVANLVENHKAKVGVKDKKGKTARQYAVEVLDKELARVKDRYKDKPEDLERETKKIEEIKADFLPMLTSKGGMKTRKLRKLRKNRKGKTRRV